MGRPPQTEPTLRQREALAMKERGMTFAQVGEVMGITKQRAEQLARMARLRREVTQREPIATDKSLLG